MATTVVEDPVAVAGLPAAATSMAEGMREVAASASAASPAASAGPIDVSGIEPTVEDEEDDDDEDDDCGESSKPRKARQREPLVPNRRVSPFDVRFSQMRARHEFRDGRLLEEAFAQIKVVQCKSEGKGTEKDGEESPTFLLEAPFPPIEMLQWRCKLRDGETGRPRVDPKTGGELYDLQDRWFTLDNRRLYCLQKAAISVWPARAFVDVVELPPGPLTRTRQLKKFRTLDRGRSVFIGGRQEGETLVRWSWHEAVGLKVEEDSEVDASGCHVQMMRRRPRQERGRGQSWQQQSRWGGNNQRADSSGEKSGAATANAWHFNATSWAGLLAFFAIYFALRILAKVLAAIYTSFR